MLGKRLAQGWRFLVEPSKRLVLSADQRSARLMASLLLPYIVYNAFGVVFAPSPVRLYIAAQLLFLVPSYFLSRTHLYKIGAVIAIFVSCIPPYGAVFSIPDFSSGEAARSLLWLIIPIFFSAFWLSTRGLLAFVVLNFIAMSMLTTIVPALYIHHIRVVLALFGISSFLIYLAAWLNERDLLELENRKNLIDSIINNVSESIVLVDSNGIVKVANEIALGKLEMRDYNERSTNIETRLKIPLSKITSGTNNREEFEMFAGTVNSFSAEMNVSTLALNGKIHYLLSIRDITERKRLEKLKDEFVTSVSHELRTPLTSIVASIGLIKGNFTDQLTADVSNLVDIADRNSKNLTLLVNDILDSAKLDAKQVQLHPVETTLEEIIADAVEENAPYAEKFSVKLIKKPIEQNQTIQVDRERLHQVLTNLISNASKFSNPNGNVEVGAIVKNNRVRFSVQDYGVGIPEDFKPKIFTRFSQGHVMEYRPVKGTGLGLSICKKTVELMAGEISFVSEVGRGSTFFVDIPIT